MRRMAFCVTGAVLLAFTVPSSIHADQGILDPGQGQRWARSAVAPFKTVAMARKPAYGAGQFRQVSTGRGGASLPDFSDYDDVQAKKLEFFEFLLPLVDEENDRLLELRTRLSYIYEHVRWDQEIDMEDRLWLHDVIQEFRIPETDVQSEEFWSIALRRVDAVPDHLVLAQAANESAWGTSRFAREGNNLFGQWCFREGCGLVPNDRPDGASYEVARFDSVNESVGSYMHNLNTGRTYQELREIRAAARLEGNEPDALAMAGGLMSYSERGEDYIRELRSMIRYNSGVIEEARTQLDDGPSS